MKMNKIIYKLLLGVALVVVVGSCDLNTMPTNSIEKEKPYKDLQNTEYVLNGTWAYMWETFNTYASPGWGTLFLVNDFMGNDVVEIGKYGYSAVYRYNAMNSGTNGQVVQIWRLAYKVIDNMNNILVRIDDVSGNDEAYRSRIKAQAYALRGYMYLSLAVSYSSAYPLDANTPCVPIYTEPTTTATKGNAKSTLTQVYQRAEDDLLEANKLIGTYQRSAKHKIDKSVIEGLLARLYLHTERWSEASEYAALAHAGYSWMAPEEYLAGFNDTSNAEWMWGHGGTTEQSNSSYIFHYKDVSSSSSYYYSMMADPYFIDYFDQNDIRYQLFEWSTAKRSAGYLMYKKFLFRSNTTADNVMMRKAEMVLIEAEALAEQNLLSQSIAKLNELRQARNADTPNLSGLSKSDLIEEILIERRKELFGEGFALSDIKRRQKAVERKDFPTGQLIPGTEIEKKGHSVTNLPDGTDFVPNSPAYNFTIPASEYTNNPNI